jgi:hypothetical protein
LRSQGEWDSAYVKNGEKQASRSDKESLQLEEL